MGKARVEVNHAELNRVARESPKLDELTRHKAQQIANRAQEVFRARQVKTNEWRLSATTPPKYVKSFRIEKFNKIRTYSWIVRNIDPAASWVEYGAHAGGRTLVLRYYPLRSALIAEGLSN